MNKPIFFDKYSWPTILTNLIIRKSRRVRIHFVTNYIKLTICCTTVASYFIVCTKSFHCVQMFIFLQLRRKRRFRSWKPKSNWKRVGMLLHRHVLRRAGFPPKFWNRALWRICWSNIRVCLCMDQVFGGNLLPFLQLPGALVFQEARKQPRLKDASQGGRSNFKHSSMWLKGDDKPNHRFRQAFDPTGKTWKNKTWFTFKTILEANEIKNVIGC